MTAREFDVILYGATGFTGRQTAAYFAEHAPKDIRWAIAGRNQTKLEAVRAETGAPALLVADAMDAVAIDALVQKTRVILTTAGPFSHYGNALVDACVKHRVHYVDITGETPWVKTLIDKHHVEAEKNGTRIIPLCGFDSVPSDLGAWICARHLKNEYQQTTKKVSASFKMSGGFNGGTLASGLYMAEQGWTREMAHTQLLNPESDRSSAERARSRDVKRVRFDKERKAWLGPFIMATVNTRVVRRSNALLASWGQGYGPEFAYEEVMEHKNAVTAGVYTAGLLTLSGLLNSRPGRALLKKFGPKPGEGPSGKTMERGFMRCRMIAEGDGGARILTTLTAQGDPGNKVTVLMLCESALALAVDGHDLPGGSTRGGLLTPATGLGDVLLERLKANGLSVTIEAV